MEHSTVFKSMARTMWCLAWADEMERRAEDGEALPWPGGAEIFDYAPDTPGMAYCEAYRFVGMLEQVNKMNIHALMWKVLGEYPDDKQVDLLAHYLVMEAIGHGASWSDSHKDHGLTVPSINGPEFDINDDKE
jgi:hypothetical protein